MLKKCSVLGKLHICTRCNCVSADSPILVSCPFGIQHTMQTSSLNDPKQISSPRYSQSLPFQQRQVLHLFRMRQHYTIQSSSSLVNMKTLSPIAAAASFDFSCSTIRQNHFACPCTINDLHHLPLLHFSTTLELLISHLQPLDLVINGDGT